MSPPGKEQNKDLLHPFGELGPLETPFVFPPHLIVSAIAKRGGDGEGLPECEMGTRDYLGVPLGPFQLSSLKECSHPLSAWGSLRIAWSSVIADDKQGRSGVRVQAC